jgi:uracil-DNA glycosylase
VTLGRLAFDVTWRLLAERGLELPRRPTFAHAAVYDPPGGPAIVASYHPSRQNTHTGRLTPAMLHDVFALAKGRVGG